MLSCPMEIPLNKSYKFFLRDDGFKVFFKAEGK